MGVKCPCISASPNIIIIVEYLPPILLTVRRKSLFSLGSISKYYRWQTVASLNSSWHFALYILYYAFLFCHARHIYYRTGNIAPDMSNERIQTTMARTKRRTQGKNKPGECRAFENASTSTTHQPRNEGLLARCSSPAGGRTSLNG